MPGREQLSRWLLVLLLGQLSVRALVGGAALLTAPAGTLVGLPPGPLDNTPFDTFLVPGLVLFVVFGLTAAVVCYGAYATRRWARPAAVGVAVALLAWVAVEVSVGFSRPTVLLNVGTGIGVLGLVALQRRQ
ncbi:hypothetical protein BVU17_06175 [Haloarcula taiwanensis]|uniref:Uncharacterized protein n=1 Tax=Haloarcula taiwanensis TaxID=1932004 RepID=A0A2H4ZXD0_9EURY|nr:MULTISPECIES: hypothetical protein [Haloarcula]AUG47134.1 hypothetical protein BVU17_06175 [Haloarcula taiwanensis]RLM33378.1 hypothetical protein DVK01_17075 [Haloarcula sp. Atlit-120R]